MKKLFPLSVLASAMVLKASVAFAATTEITVDYPYPDLFRKVHTEIADAFMKQNPDIKVVFKSTTPEYEAAAQQSLRQAMTNQLVDVSYHGLNRIRVFADRGMTADLTPFIKAEKDWDSLGYSESLLTLGQVNGQQVGIGFALSTPIVYFNENLVRQAGVDPQNFPQTWEGIWDVARKVNALGNDVNGLYFNWQITGNWLWQALVFANGGSMLTADEKQVAFGQKPGQDAIVTLADMVRKGDMTDMQPGAAMQSFIAGKLGVLVTSTSTLGKVTQQVGDRFPLRTSPFPVPNDQAGRLPAGGNVAVMFAKDPAKQKAAWEYIKFATGPVGSTIMVRHTGYFPGNTIPATDARYLKDFYDQNPNHMTAINQLGRLTGWYAFPGENGLKITDVINDAMQTVVAGKQEPAAVLDAMVADTQALLPK